MKELSGALKQAKPYLAAILLRFVAAGLIVIAKIALNEGMSPQVYSLYRYCVAAIVVAPFALLFDRFLSGFRSDLFFLWEMA